MYAQPKIRPGEWDAQTSLGFRDTNRSSNLDSQQQQQQKRWRKKRADHRVKIKESEKRYKYIVLTREFLKLWNMTVNGIPIVVVALGTVPKRLMKELEDFEIRKQVETIQTTALLRSARILRRVLETWGNLLSLKLQWETTSVSWCEKLSKE